MTAIKLPQDQMTQILIQTRLHNLLRRHIKVLPDPANIIQKLLLRHHHNPLLSLLLEVILDLIRDLPAPQNLDDSDRLQDFKIDLVFLALFPPDHPL